MINKLFGLPPINQPPILKSSFLSKSFISNSIYFQLFFLPFFIIIVILKVWVDHSKCQKTTIPQMIDF